MITLFETSIKTLKQLEERCDAKVISKFGDHKYIFLNSNKPDNLIPDSKNRKKNNYYIKDDKKLYYVVVDMYELPSIIMRDKDYADIWVVDNLQQAQEQLDIIIKFGAKQFQPYIRTKD